MRLYPHVPESQRRKTKSSRGSSCIFIRRFAVADMYLGRYCIKIETLVGRLENRCVKVLIKQLGMQPV